MNHSCVPASRHLESVVSPLGRNGLFPILKGYVMADHLRIFTTPFIQDIRILAYNGYVTAKSVRAINILRDVFTSIRDVVGGRSESYQEVMQDMQREVIREIWDEALQSGGNAIIGFHMDFENIGAKGNSLLLAYAQGTAVTLEEGTEEQEEEEDSQ